MSEIYQCRILDKNLQLKAILKTENWSYKRRRNEATDISVSVPKNELERKLATNGRLYQELVREQSKHLKVAYFIQIWKDEQLKASGKITSRDAKRNVVEIKAFTEEILLERNITPAQYGKVFEGVDIADLARGLTLAWDSKRIKSQSQWESSIESSNVDLETEPGVVFLDKIFEDDYFESGYIIIRFEKTNYSDFVNWDRIRWLSDNESPVSTTIQYRYGEEGSLSSFTTEVSGALTDELGLEVAATDETILDVKINLYTNDTTTTPGVFSLEVVARTRFDLEIGDIPTSTPLNIDTLDADYRNGLDLLQEACEQTGTEFKIQNKKMSLARDLGRNLTNDVLLKSGQNMKIATLSDDDEDLANDVIGLGEGDGINRLRFLAKNEESIAEYGRYPKIVEFDTASIEELELLTLTYLEENSSPVTAFSIDAIFEHGNEPDYQFGDTVKIADPDTGLVTNSRIEEEKRSCGRDGLRVNLNLEKSSKRLLDGVLGKNSIGSAKSAEYLILFEKDWAEIEVPSPFYELYPAESLFTAEDLYPSIDQEYINLYIALYDSSHNELARKKYSTRNIKENVIQSTFFIIVDSNIPDQVAYVGWVGDITATENTNTGVIIDKQPFETEFRFISLGKTDRKVW